MSDKDTGGPAFPVSEESLMREMPGMTLRDYFAAKAMSGWLASWGDSPFPSGIDQIAVNCYGLADAMLEARK